MGILGGKRSIFFLWICIGKVLGVREGKDQTRFILFCFLSVSGFRKTRSHLVAQIGLEFATLLLQPSEWLPVMLCTQRWLVLRPHPGLSVVTIPNSEVHLEVWRSQSKIQWGESQGCALFSVAPYLSTLGSAINRVQAQAGFPSQSKLCV